MNTRRGLAQQLLPIIACGVSSVCLAHSLFAQRPTHQHYRASMPPGTVGAMQAAHLPSRQGYVQPVEFRVPDGATVAVASDGGFGWESSRLRAGLLVGQVYRFRISSIPRQPTAQLYPSIELLDRLHPPPDQKHRFPIPVEITQEDLELALAGTLVVRVVYLENPHAAFPAMEPDTQRSFDLLPSEDPLHVADELGRPMAIIRLGSRVPLGGEVNDAFLFGSPPVELLDGAEPVGIESAPEWPLPSTHDAVPPVLNPVPETPVPGVEKRDTRPDVPLVPDTDMSDPFLDDAVR